MKAFVFDVETTGLPVWDKPSDDPCQPRIIQICAELFDDRIGTVIAGMNTIIRPDGWVISDEIAALTGITQDAAMEHGIPIDDALPMFMAMWGRAELRVAHNQSFDARMIRIELMRTRAESISTPEVAEEWKGGVSYCTMRNAQKVMGVKKPPNLSEAFSHFTGSNMMNAHNAVADVYACKRVYMALTAKSDPSAGAAPVTIFEGSPAQTDVNKADLWPGA